MVFGMRSASDPKVREALLKVATTDVASMGSKSREQTYLAALYVEQCRTNDLLEQLVTEKSGVAQ